MVKPWWTQIVPLTEQELTTLSMRQWLAYNRLVAHDAKVADFGMVIASIRIGKNLCKYYNEPVEETFKNAQKNINEILRCIRNSEAYNDDLMEPVFDALNVVDHMLKTCERFRISRAIKEARL